MDIEKAITLLQKSKTPYMKPVHSFPIKEEHYIQRYAYGACPGPSACGACGVGACKGKVDRRGSDELIQLD